MRIAIIRGDFASPWEIQNFRFLLPKHEVTIFTGRRPVAEIHGLSGFRVEKLLSPVDLNFGRISRISMGLLNRLFVDAHVLFGLEKALGGYDIAHCAETYFFYTQQCIEAKKRGLVKAVVSTVWENIAFNNESIHGRKAFKKSAFKYIDAFLPVTTAARRTLLDEGCPGRKVTILNPGVDVNLFKPLKIKSYRGIRKNRGLKILFVGRLEKEKGIMEIIRLFSKVRWVFKDVELLVVGQGTLSGSIGAPGVKLLGRIPYKDMPSVYSLCDIFVHYPIGSRTWQEQYGMVLVEALACGLPVVALNKGCVAEIVEGAGIVTSGEEFMQKLIELIRNQTLREELSLKSRLLATRKYSSYVCARKLEEVYERVLKGK